MSPLEVAAGAGPSHASSCKVPFPFSCLPARSWPPFGLRSLSVSPRPCTAAALTVLVVSHDGRLSCAFLPPGSAPGAPGSRGHCRFPFTPLLRGCGETAGRGSGRAATPAPGRIRLRSRSWKVSLLERPPQAGQTREGVPALPCHSPPFFFI